MSLICMSFYLSIPHQSWYQFYCNSTTVTRIWSLNKSIIANALVSAQQSSISTNKTSFVGWYSLILTDSLMKMCQTMTFMTTLYKLYEFKRLLVNVVQVWWYYPLTDDRWISCIKRPCKIKHISQANGLQSWVFGDANFNFRKHWNGQHHQM